MVNKEDMETSQPVPAPQKDQPEPEYLEIPTFYRTTTIEQPTVIGSIVNMFKKLLGLKAC